MVSIAVSRLLVSIVVLPFLILLFLLLGIHGIVIIVDIRLICIVLQQLDIDEPLFLAITHETSVLVILPRRIDTVALLVVVRLLMVSLIVSILVLLIVLEKRLMLLQRGWWQWGLLLVVVELSILVLLLIARVRRGEMVLLIHVVIGKRRYYRAVVMEKLRWSEIRMRWWLLRCTQKKGLVHLYSFGSITADIIIVVILTGKFPTKAP